MADDALAMHCSGVALKDFPRDDCEAVMMIGRTLLGWHYAPDTRGGRLYAAGSHSIETSMEMLGQAVIFLRGADGEYRKLCDGLEDDDALAVHCSGVALKDFPRGECEVVMMIGLTRDQRFCFAGSHSIETSLQLLGQTALFLRRARNMAALQGGQGGVDGDE